MKGAASARASWLAQRERGSETLMRLMMAIALIFGHRAAALCLYPICAYFVVFSGRARRASRDYLRRVTAGNAHRLDTFRHYHCFASTILDRVYLSAGRLGLFDIEYDGLDLLRAHVAARRGCILLGAHFGSFDVLRAVAIADPTVDLRILMHTGDARKMDNVLRAVDERCRAASRRELRARGGEHNGKASVAGSCKRLPDQIIELGHPGTMLAVRDAIAGGALVALLADRAIVEDRRAECEFLGAPALFPEGPFALARVLRAPVILFAAVRCGRQRYRIRFEPFVTGDEPGADCAAFARWLERNCLDAPLNWFNFYDFWAAGPAERRRQ